MRGQRSGLHRLVNPKTLPPEDRSRGLCLERPFGNDPAEMHNREGRVGLEIPRPAVNYLNTPSTSSKYPGKAYLGRTYL